MSEHPVEDVAPVVAAFIDTTNAGDSDGFVALFTDDAVLTDYGRRFEGRDGARSWDRTDNIGTGAHFVLLGHRSGARSDEVVITVDVTGRGFTGTSDITLTVRGDRIAGLLIEP